jgi:formylglycine-generating enzyme required for sulfatase activity
VAVSVIEGNEAFVPFEVERSKDPLRLDRPPSAPDGTVLVPTGRVKGPLGESQVPALLWERTEVTVERYGAWLATLPADEQAQRVPRVAGALGEAPRPVWDKREGRFIPPKSLAALAPVEGISLYDARAFAAAQGRRLPTAQEWAWAATGPFAAPTPVGSLDAVFSLPLVVGAGAQRAVAVGGSEDDVGPFGLKDMAGNVAEWTATLTTYEGTNGWLVMGSGYGLPPERAIVTRAVPEPGWKPLQGVGFRCVLPAP